MKIEGSRIAAEIMNDYYKEKYYKRKRQNGKEKDCNKCSVEDICTGNILYKEGKMKVRATNKYEKLNLQDNELKRIPKAGEEFEVSKERFEVLNGNNSYKTVFVEKVEEVEKAVKKAKTEKAVKKQQRKLNNNDI